MATEREQREQRDQRRLSAIVAADMVGYSRLMRADQSGTLARLKALRNEVFDPLVAEFRGRIVKTTGDGFLIEFPSVVDALQSTIEIQRAMASRNAAEPEEWRIELRAEVTLGDIIVDGERNRYGRLRDAVRDRDGAFQALTGTHDWRGDRRPGDDRVPRITAAAAE
ncbi:MAG: adenylate/guanylate cyclase domain-containing protein [Alphaproteobacteria bacterium]